MTERVHVTTYPLFTDAEVFLQGREREAAWKLKEHTRIVQVAYPDAGPMPAREVRSWWKAVRSETEGAIRAWARVPPPPTTETPTRGWVARFGVTRAELGDTTALVARLMSDVREAALRSLAHVADDHSECLGEPCHREA